MAMFRRRSDNGAAAAVAARRSKMSDVPDGAVSPLVRQGQLVTRIVQKFAPDEVVDLDDELRSVMYRPGAGT